jgi:pimeloyl-ACP methyl ester carboxylesterase
VRDADPAARRTPPRHAHRRRPVTARRCALVGEFLDRLDLRGVTLVGNDTGGALVQLLIRRSAARVGRIVLVSCDAFDNYPPGLTGRTLVLTGKLPPWIFGLFMLRQPESAATR